jgi:hypothetical protein
MKRLLKYDAMIAAAALLTWTALVVVEVKFKEFWFFKYIFWASLAVLFVAFPAAGLLAFRDHPKNGAITALVSLVFTPIFIGLGVMLVLCLKIAIGGHAS